MYYCDNPSRALRFGDVLEGYPSIKSILPDKLSKSNLCLNLSLEANRYCVVLTPCCSIKDKQFVITPLQPINPKFFTNPFFDEDLLRINNLNFPENNVPPNSWDKMPQEYKDKLSQKGKDYAFLNFFIYKSHDLLPTYTLNLKNGKRTTNYYLIDFKETTVIQSKSIISPTEAPLDTKLLELSVNSRVQLRHKITHYYSRVPEEEQAEHNTSSVG